MDTLWIFYLRIIWKDNRILLWKFSLPRSGSRHAYLAHRFQDVSKDLLVGASAFRDHCLQGFRTPKLLIPCPAVTSKFDEMLPVDCGQLFWMPWLAGLRSVRVTAGLELRIVVKNKPWVRGYLYELHPWKVFVGNDLGRVYVFGWVDKMVSLPLNTSGMEFRLPQEEALELRFLTDRLE